MQRTLGLVLLACACSKTEGAGTATSPSPESVGTSTLPRQQDPQKRLLQALRSRPVRPKDAEVPTYKVRPLAKGEHLKMDGKLDEPAWAHAEKTRPFVHPGTGEPMPHSAAIGGTARLCYDAKTLYIAIEAHDTNVRGGFEAGALDPHLWTRDTVEIMLDPEGDGDNLDYYELQINPQGLVFDSQFDSYNAPRNLPHGPFGHEDWNAQVKRGVTVQGTLDNASDRDEGYIVEVALPFASLAKLRQNPPKPGTEWRANLYVMKDNGGVSWSPILGQGNFHRASRFGRLLFMP